MIASRCARSCAGMGVFLGLCLGAQACFAQRGDPTRGQQLFERAWEPFTADAPAADGLGPLFNERSCAACHFQAGIGGAGPNDKNVDLLTPLGTKGPRLEQLHPAFASVSTLVLHKFSTDPLPYDELRARLLGFDHRIRHDRDKQQIAARALAKKQGGGPVRTIRVEGTRLAFSQRNTPPLFGLGLIERITPTQIEAAARQQRRANPKLKGRFAGRFGLRGQVADLSNFIRSACANELGLRVETHRQPIDPLATAEENHAPRQVDITLKQCDDLTAFVARLPRPRRLLTDDRRQMLRIKSGEHLFEDVGCADCHRPRLANVSGLYSDLLLHDMGAGLEDPAPSPTEEFVRTSGAGYYETFAMVTEPALTEARRQWKTPPLWGLRDSGPYLHDGRAETVEQAIAAHGGEAWPSARRYKKLPRRLQQNMLMFLATLAAPASSELPQAQVASTGR